MIERTIRVCICCAVLTALVPFATAGGGAPRTLAELAPHPELWPEEVTILIDADFQNGRSIRKGQVVQVAEVLPDGVKLDDGNMFFRLEADQTDLIERVEALVGSLTPEQLELKLADVRRRPELWPERVRLRVPITTGDGAELSGGQELILLGFQPDGQIQVASIEQRFTVPVDPWLTDLFELARRRLLLPDAAAVRFPIRSLETMLQPSADGTTVADLDYIVFYQGRDSCPRATHYAPELAALQQSTANEGAKWGVVFLNAVDSPEMNRIHHRNMGLTGRTARDGFGHSIMLLLSLETGPPTPWVYVLDREGRQIASVSDDGTSFPPDAVFDVLAQRIAGPGG